MEIIPSEKRFGLVFQTERGGCKERWRIRALHAIFLPIAVFVLSTTITPPPPHALNPNPNATLDRGHKLGDSPDESPQAGGGSHSRV